MTIPTFTTFVAGTVVTAAQLNTQIVNAGNFFLAPPACWVYNNAGVSLTSGTSTLIPFDTENIDNDAMHSTVTNPSRIIFNTLGTWELHFHARVPAGGTIGAAQTGNARLNSGGASGGGSSVSTFAVPRGGATSLATFNDRTFWYQPANVGDYFEFFVTQASGGTLTTDNGGNVTGAEFRWIGAY